MENRWSDRNPIELEAMIIQNETPIIKCKTENICIEGVTLKLAPAVSIDGIPQNVQLSFFGEDQINIKPIPARIIHSSSECIGLMFNIEDDIALQDIKKLLHRAGAYD